LADDDKQDLAVDASDQGVMVQLPASAPDPVCSVVVLETAGELEIAGGGVGE
jgi:hypothetical protein